MNNLPTVIRTLDDYCRKFMRHLSPSWELKVAYSWNPNSSNFTKPCFCIKIIGMEQVYYLPSTSDPAEALSKAITMAIAEHKKMEREVTKLEIKVKKLRINNG